MFDTQPRTHTAMEHKNKKRGRAKGKQKLAQKNLDARIKVHFNQKQEDKFQSKNCNCTQELLQTKHLHTLRMWLEAWINTQSEAENAFNFLAETPGEKRPHMQL